MTKEMAVQDRFLQQMKEKERSVVMYLMNGFQIRGLIQEFDEETVLVENEQRQQLVYKHAISTISPVNRRELQDE